MSTPLTPEERTQYTRIVDDILATCNLQTVTRKKIRQGLEKSLGGKDLDSQKDAIKKLIEERFDAISQDDAPPAPAALPAPLNMPSMPLTMPTRPSPPPTKPNGYSPDTDEDTTANGEIRVSLPPAKKIKRDESEDADAKLAAMLQEQEDSLSRARKTRGGGAAKPAKKKKAPKKKSKATVDDSDVEGSGEETAGKKRKAGGGFSKPFNLSPALSDLCGEPTLPRPQVVKKIWEHIRAEKLQDPADKRNIICDDKMLAVFKQSKISMFQMNKHLGNHLYPVETEEAT